MTPVTAVHVLLVEDEELVRTLVAEVLRDKGFAVTEACTGDEAAELLAEVDGFDAVLTDVRMPGILDGIDLAVRARERHPGVPVLVVSGYAHELSPRLRTLNPPAVFIRKPFKLRDILDMLGRLTLKT